MNFKFISIFVILLSLIFLGCVGQKPVGTPTPTATPTATATPEPTVVVTTPQPTQVPVTTSKPYPISYRVWVDTDYGFRIVRALNGSESYILPSNFDRFNFTINVGDKVRWINDDRYGYKMTIVSAEGLWENQTMRYNNSFFDHTFNESGNYTVYIQEKPTKPHQRIIVNP